MASENGGDIWDDLAVVLCCQTVGDVIAICLFRTEESQYIFPRAMPLVCHTRKDVATPLSL
eukprot:6222410-Amphidinium_carterae.1